MKYYINRTNPSLSGIDSLFSDLFGDNFYSSRIPQVDVYETPSSYVVEADVAGYEEGSIQISVEKHVLTLASEDKNLKKANAEEAKEEKKDERKYLMREISRPSFSRSFTLPEDVDEASIKAEGKNGILTLTIPKKTPEERGRIEIKIN
ncbi:MAG: Hsp20/alpha crystallin family protein [Candidatus Ornithospirochaeta sp.]